MLGAIAYEKGNFFESISKFKKAIKLQKDEHQFLFGIAKSLIAVGKFDKAQNYLQKAHSAAENSSDKNKYQSKLSALHIMSRKR